MDKLESISEYAKRIGVSRQSVYQKIKKQDVAKQLKGHIIKTNGVKYLDDVAIELLESLQSTTQAKKENLINDTTLIENDVVNELQTLREENTKLKDEILEKSNKYETVLEQLVLAQKQLADKEKELLELKERDPEPTPERKGLFARLFGK